MTINDLGLEVYWALSANKVRSFLTVLGIVIGIASVIGMVAIGAGAQASVDASIQSIGSNLIIVVPGAARGVGIAVSSGRGSATTLTLADADAITLQVPDAKTVAPELSRRYQVAAKGTNTNTQVVGTTTAYPEVRNVQIDTGSFITQENLQSASKVAVLGPTTRDDLFGQGIDPIGSSIRIGTNQFKVIGTTKSKGGSGFNNPDDVIYIPLSAAQRYLAGTTASISQISIEANSATAMTNVQNEVTALLLQQHKIADPTQADFSVINQADIVNAASSVTNTFTVLLASIAGISLLVGGIGIMNMMLTSVTERTREIGLRKAIGAQSEDITMQFLLESIALTLLGGVIGIGLGWLLAWGAYHFASIATTVSWQSVLLAVGVSAAIGIIFGWYPARRASKLDPIVALRYE